MSRVGSVKLTSRQYLQLGEDPPGVRLELINGEINVSPSPSPYHSQVDRRLGTILQNYIDKHSLGELMGDVDVVFDDLNTRRPDILFVAKDRLNIIHHNGIFGSPDLCVEIISPSSASEDRVEKFALYQKHGVANYWLVDQHPKMVEAFVLKEGVYQLAVTGRDREVVKMPPFGELGMALGDIWPKG